MSKNLRAVALATVVTALGATPFALAIHSRPAQAMSHVTLLAAGQAPAGASTAALSQGQPPAPLELASKLYTAVAAKHYGVAVGALLLLIVFALRKLLADKTPEPIGFVERFRAFLHTDFGGVLADLVIGFALTFGTVLLAGKPITWGVAQAAVAMAAGSAGAIAFLTHAYAAFKAWRAGKPLPKPPPASAPTK